MDKDRSDPQHSSYGKYPRNAHRGRTSISPVRTACAGIDRVGIDLAGIDLAGRAGSVRNRPGPDRSRPRTGFVRNPEAAANRSFLDQVGPLHH